jgi:uncharacterized membrane protein
MYKVYGLKNSMHLLVFSSIVAGLSGLLGPILAKFVIKEKSDYLVLFMTGGVFTIISLLICYFFISEEKFDYKVSDIDSTKVKNTEEKLKIKNDLYNSGEETA